MKADRRSGGFPPCAGQSGAGEDGFVNTWRNTGRWVVVALLRALAPVPVVVGQLMLSDRGATTITAAIVAIGVAATIMCLLGSVVAARLTLRSPQQGPSQERSPQWRPAQWRPAQRKPARHATRGHQAAGRQ